MDKDQLIEALEKALGDADLSSVAAAALDAVRNATTIAISHDVETGSIERRSILGTYLLRQRRLKMTGGRVEGFDETIASLKKRECLRMHGITVNLGERFLSLLTQPSGEVVGCFFLEPPLDSSQV